MDGRRKFFANNLMAFLKYQFHLADGGDPDDLVIEAEVARPIALCDHVAYWHSEDVTCYAWVKRCPVCTFSHPVVILYNHDDHEELDPHDFLTNVLLPCGTRADLILERECSEGRI